LPSFIKAKPGNESMLDIKRKYFEESFNTGIMLKKSRSSANCGFKFFVLMHVSKKKQADKNCICYKHE
jgi:hypothetical protein